MNANAHVYPGTWPEGTPDLGVLDLTYVQPIQDAAYHWSTSQLPLGDLATWTDRNAGKVLAAPAGDKTQVPVVYESYRKVLRFDGVNDRMEVPLELPGPFTLAVVGRFATAANGQYLITGGQYGGHFNLYQGGNGNFAFYAGKTVASTKPGDTGNHVFLIVSDGANSVLNIDGQEWAGDSGANVAPGIRLGASAGGFFGGDIQMLAVLPYAAGAARREALVAQLRTQYNI